MSALDRRAFLTLGGAAAAVSALPFAPQAAQAVTPAAAVKPLPTWIVGTPGEADHEIIRAATREAAILFRAEECEFEDDPDADPSAGEGGQGCECCACTDRGGFEATRVEAWDRRKINTITDADWVRAGFDGTCDRCGETADPHENGTALGDKAICGDCMTIADWEIVDPEYAAELRAEVEDDERDPDHG